MSDSEEFFQFMDGYCFAFDGLPDGAWLAACQEGVGAWNQEKKEQLDPYDGVMLWIENRKELVKHA